MKSILLMLYLTLMIALELFGQEYGYTHYSIREGLAGSTAYCMTQDKDGFIWFGTETGLSRFDGTHFKNYFKADGLPENQILQLFADSRGRVWMAPFNQSVCYYYKGKIYNQQNDSLLSRIRVNNFILHFAEDEAGNILMQESTGLHLLSADGKVTTFEKIGSHPIRNCITIAKRNAGGFWMIENDRMYEIINKRIIPVKKMDIFTKHVVFVRLIDSVLIRCSNVSELSSLNIMGGKKTNFPFKDGHINLAVIDNKNVAQCTRNGAYLHNLDKPDSTLKFLPNVPVSNVIKDSEGSIWFSSLGQGVYRLNSKVVQNINLGKYHPSGQQVFCFARDQRSILVGTGLNLIYRLNPVTGKIEKEKIVFRDYGIDPIFDICTYGKQKIIYASQHCMFKLSGDYKWQKRVHYITVKKLVPFKDKILAATSRNVAIMDPDRFVFTDTIWHERSTTVFADYDTFYIGTLRGLYCMYPGKQPYYLGKNIPLFQNLIVAIVKDSNNVLWIATSGEGVLGYKNGKIVAHIDQQQGLTSNTCRAILLHGHTLWIGTDKGLNEIDLLQPGNPVQRKYTTGDGLASEMINAIYVEGSKVFVGTPEGVTFFDEQKIESQSRCDLLFTNMTISGQSHQWDSSILVIPHTSNNIRFDYVGISFKSAGDIRYRYRLLGLDSVWRETRETFLSYPTLPSGDYALQVQAVNKFDVSSHVITAKFTIEKLLWGKDWFRLLAGFIFIGLTGLLVWVIVYRIRRREGEKTAISKRIGELEQLARKAQMNPHFIFNSLNSIQQYVMDTDLAGANKFISGFSRLIRQTLEFSARQEISLEEEVDYLSNYLELEKSRLEDAFSWQVIIPDTINPADYYLPPMILQPFVENSVRHGLRLRKDKAGKIVIRIKKEHNFLTCMIEDNGVGRKAAQRLKSISHIEYQSRGMSLTAERIALLNKDNANRITMQIEDLEDEQHLALGTRVTINFPIK